MRRYSHDYVKYLLVIAVVMLCGYMLIFIRLGNIQDYKGSQKTDIEILGIIRKMREYGYINASVINLIDTRLRQDLYASYNSQRNNERFAQGGNYYIDTGLGEELEHQKHLLNQSMYNELETSILLGDKQTHSDFNNRALNNEHQLAKEVLLAEGPEENEKEQQNNNADRHTNVNEKYDENKTQYIQLDTGVRDNRHTEIEKSFDISDNDDHIYLVDNTYSHRIANEHVNGTYTFAERYKEAVNESYEYRKRIYNTYHTSNIGVNSFDCTGIINGDASEIHQSTLYMDSNPKPVISPLDYTHIKNCEWFKRTRGYIDHPLTRKERDFPLAYSIITYKSIEQVERLLRAIYRPQNYYCIHVDLGSKPTYKKALKTISRCFNNVFVAEKSVNVSWGDFTVLEAEMVCLSALWNYSKWIYYINLTGQEFPLKTNLEIVEILNAMHGANIVDGTWVRARQKYFYRWTRAGDRPPHQIRPIKGSVHVAMNRHMADFALHDQRSLDFLEWLKKTLIPDETFFASLNHNPHLGIIGSFLGAPSNFLSPRSRSATSQYLVPAPTRPPREPEEYPLKPSFMRYKNWELGLGVWARTCTGKYVRGVCILGVGDVSRAIADVGLFVNKFHIDFQYLALDCVEEWLYRRTWDQYMNNAHVDVTFYEHLDQVKYQLKERGDLP